MCVVMASPGDHWGKWGRSFYLRARLYCQSQPSNRSWTNVGKYSEMLDRWIWCGPISTRKAGSALLSAVQLPRLANEIFWYLVKLESPERLTHIHTDTHMVDEGPPQGAWLGEITETTDPSGQERTWGSSGPEVHNRGSLGGNNSKFCFH